MIIYGSKDLEWVCKENNKIQKIKKAALRN